MGTRNLTMVISNGKIKVAQYGQWDGYPSGQGATVLEFCKKANWDKFKDQLDKLNWLTDEQCEEIEKDPNWDNSHPYLSRDAAAQILYAIHYGEMTAKRRLTHIQNIVGLSDHSEFAADSLFCEWAYVIDLDKNTLEVFKGFNKTPLSSAERFYYLQKEDKEYCPVKLAKEYSLDNLPEEDVFVSEFEDKDEE